MFNGSTSETTEQLPLFKHQISLVNELLGAQLPLRAIIQAPVGSGKSAAVAAFLGALKTELKREPRCMVLAPIRAFQDNWIASLRRFGRLDSQSVDIRDYRNMQLAAPASVNPWSITPSVVTSIDFLKPRQRLEEALDSNWDAIVIDEVHLCRAATQRGELAETIWYSSAPRVLGVSPFPITNPKLLESATTTIRWDLSSIVGLKDQRVPARRTVQAISFELNEAEVRFVQYFSTETEKALQRNPRNRLAIETLRQVVSSSLFAAEQSLRRRLLRITSIQDAVEEESFLEDVLDDHSMQHQDFKFMTPQICKEAIRLIELIEIDSKWEVCKLLVEDLLQEDSRLLVVCDYRDTAHYLVQQFEEIGQPVHVLTAEVALPEKIRRVTEGLRGGVLIATAVALEGVPTLETERILHYDAPTNINRLIRRLQSIEFSSYKASVLHYFLLPSNDARSHVFRSLLDEL